MLSQQKKFTQVSLFDKRFFGKNQPLNEELWWSQTYTTGTGILKKIIWKIQSNIYAGKAENENFKKILDML